MPALQASRLSLTEALARQGGNAQRGSMLRAPSAPPGCGVARPCCRGADTCGNGAAIDAIDLGYETPSHLGERT